MDGVSNNSDNIIIIGATNNPNMIDKALLRPGRFDDLLYIPLPDIEARIAIIKIYTMNLPINSEENLDFNELGLLSEGLSGAEIEYCIKEIVMKSLRRNENLEYISNSEFIEGFKQIKPSIHERDLEVFKSFKK